jgi:hypothetical protein
MTDLEKANEIMRKRGHFVANPATTHEDIIKAVAEGIALGRAEGRAEGLTLVADGAKTDGLPSKMPRLI